MAGTKLESKALAIVSTPEKLENDVEFNIETADGLFMTMMLPKTELDAFMSKRAGPPGDTLFSTSTREAKYAVASESTKEYSVTIEPSRAEMGVALSPSSESDESSEKSIPNEEEEVEALASCLVIPQDQENDTAIADVTHGYFDTKVVRVHTIVTEMTLLFPDSTKSQELSNDPSLWSVFKPSQGLNQFRCDGCVKSPTPKSKW